MSGGPKAPKSAGTRALQAAVLVALFAISFGARRVMPGIASGSAALAAVGFLLLAGTLMSELFDVLRLPHLTGYIAAGVLAGPYALDLVDHHTVERLADTNSLALALIALEGGAELRLDALREGSKSLSWAMLLQTLPVALVCGAVFVLARPVMPFMAALPVTAVIGAGLLWGVISMTRSPSAALGILSQTRAKGPVMRFSLNFIMVSDIVVVVLMTVGIMIARPLCEPTSTFAFREEFGRLGRELLGSVALGTSLGLVLAGYLRFVGKQTVLVYVAIGFGMTEILKYLGFEPLLTFMVAGFVVQNLSKQGDKLLHTTGQVGSVVYVVFFAHAGAHLNVPLLQRLWPVALLFFGVRAAVTFGAGKLSARIANDPPVLRTWGWAGLISQAGVALGVANTIASQFPAFGPNFRDIAVACVGLNELVGPVLFKLALDRTGESSKAPRASLSSLAAEAASH